jgi:thiamine pyrophosphate-dependent acetolactate synthase large subunit-like protein
MGAQTVASALAALVSPWVGGAFHVAGAGNLPFIAAWSERGLPWFSALEEKRGLTMAEGYARASGRLGLMSVTAGPGVTNLASGLLVALRERTPVLVVCGQTPLAYGGRLPVQELDIRSFARELTLRAHELTSPEQLPVFANELVRTAIDRRRPGPTLLAVPADLWALPCPTCHPIRLPAPFGRRAAARCAERLARAERPLILAGSGVVRGRATPELFALVELLPHVRVATTPRALGAFPATHPRAAGVLGFGGNGDAALDDSDLVLVLGSRLHEMSTNFDARWLARPLVHLDLDPEVPGLVIPADGFVTDLVPALRAMAAALRRSAPEVGGTRARSLRNPALTEVAS